MSEPNPCGAAFTSAELRHLARSIQCASALAAPPPLSSKLLQSSLQSLFYAYSSPLMHRIARSFPKALCATRGYGRGRR